MTVLFVAPLHKELEFFTQVLRDQGYSASAAPIGRIAALHFPALDLAVAHGGHGKTQFGVQTQHLLDHASDLEALICVGAAGALAADLAVGDLVLATATVEHDYTERFSPHPLPRFDADAALLSSLRQLPLHTLPFGVHSGIVASGDEDVIELERAAALRQATEACAVAWEGAGGARASRFSGTPFLELRAITDTADHAAPADFAANLRIAISNAATLAVLWRAA
jgi:adenosylhomocysteine nucleosidase